MRIKNMQGCFLRESVRLQHGGEAGRNFAHVLKDQRSSQTTSLQAESFMACTSSDA